MLNILSLGAGVQSSTVLLMSCKGVLPKLDAAIFADTQWEPKAVYEYLAFLSQQSMKANIPIFTVSKGNLRSDFLASMDRPAADGKKRTSIPVYTRQTVGQTYQDGQLWRTCTADYKITPIRQWLEKHRMGEKVLLWFGISGDEMRRMRMSQIRWIEHYYPLIYGMPHPYHRHECLSWLKKNGFPDPPRSACLGCPYHSDDEWRNLKHNKKEFSDAVEFDHLIRSPSSDAIKSTLFLHRSCRPLAEVDFENAEDKGQQNWLNECEGMCGV